MGSEVVEASIIESDGLVMVPSRRPSRVTGGIPHLDEYLMIAERISRTEMVPSAFRGKPNQILAVVLYGAEIGIGPMFALQSINFIEGKPSVSPELMRALIRQAGHKLDITSTKTECVIVGERCDTGEVGQSEFTLVDAVAAGLCRMVDGSVQSRSRDGKALPWEKYTKDMLLARATSRIARMMFSDAIAGMSYTPEEIESFTPASSPRQIASNAVPSEETGELASDDQMDELVDALGDLTEDEQAIVKTKWIDAALPPLQRGLTTTQARQAKKLVNDVQRAKKGDENDESLATTTQVRAINTLLSKVHVVGPARHDAVRDIIERRVDSLNELTKDEATTVIDHLKGNESSPSVTTSPDNE